MKNLIVSAADSNYSHLLIELYNSIDFSFQKSDFAIFDCGLDEKTLNYFKAKNIQIKRPDWEYGLPFYKTRGRENLKIQFSRFFMEKYFSGYDNYIWLDSDTWINCNKTFNLYIQGAEKTGFCVTPQVDRSYRKLINIKWLFAGIPKKINSINYKNISKSISVKLATKYAGFYTLNAGCFSYNKKFKNIDILRNNLKKASRKGRIFGSDQVALALTNFHDDIKFELLPSYCNWLCELKIPSFSKFKNCFVEPFLPNHNIGVMHLAGLNNDRKLKYQKYEINLLEGGKILKSLRSEI